MVETNVPYVCVILCIIIIMLLSHFVCLYYFHIVFILFGGWVMFVADRIACFGGTDGLLFCERMKTMLSEFKAARFGQFYFELNSPANHNAHNHTPI